MVPCRETCIFMPNHPTRAHAAHPRTLTPIDQDAGRDASARLGGGRGDHDHQPGARADARGDRCGHFQGPRGAGLLRQRLDASLQRHRAGYRATATARRCQVRRTHIDRAAKRAWRRGGAFACGALIGEASSLLAARAPRAPRRQAPQSPHTRPHACHTRPGRGMRRGVVRRRGECRLILVRPKSFGVPHARRAGFAASPGRSEGPRQAPCRKKNIKRALREDASAGGGRDCAPEGRGARQARHVLGRRAHVNALNARHPRRPGRCGANVCASPPQKARMRLLGGCRTRPTCAMRAALCGGSWPGASGCDTTDLRG